MDFLPNDYTTPSSGGGYMKLQQGDNRIRILSKPIIGWLDWEDDGQKKTPHRFPMDKKPSKPLGKNPIRHFWALLVFDYSDNLPKILEITQSVIQNAITDLARDKDWGAPFYYDIKISKKGDGLNTKYTINPSPKKPIDPDHEKLAIDKPCYLPALFLGNDPWDVPEEATPTIIETSSLPF